MQSMEIPVADVDTAVQGEVLDDNHMCRRSRTATSDERESSKLEANNDENSKLLRRLATPSRGRSLPVAETVAQEAFPIHDETDEAQVVEIGAEVAEDAVLPSSADAIISSLQSAKWLLEETEEQLNLLQAYVPCGFKFKKSITASANPYSEMKRSITASTNADCDFARGITGSTNDDFDTNEDFDFARGITGSTNDDFDFARGITGSTNEDFDFARGITGSTNDRLASALSSDSLLEGEGKSGDAEDMFQIDLGDVGYELQAMSFSMPVMSFKMMSQPEMKNQAAKPTSWDWPLAHVERKVRGLVIDRSVLLGDIDELAKEAGDSHVPGGLGATRSRRNRRVSH